MKELFINIITKIINYTKTFFVKILNKIKFEERKNGIIKVMYNSIIQKKRKEKNRLLFKLDTIKLQAHKLEKEMNIIKEENMVYNKKIDTLNSFQDLLVNNSNIPL